MVRKVALGGLLGSLFIIVILAIGRWLGFSQVSPELALGQLITDRSIGLARLVGTVWFLCNGTLIAFAYWFVLSRQQIAGWRIGAVYGFIQAILAAYLYQVILILPEYIPGRIPSLETSQLSPTVLGFGGGAWTAMLILFSHAVYGAVVGHFVLRVLNSGLTRRHQQRAA